MWTLSGLDATSKWLMAAGLPLLLVSWVRYAVHVVLVLAVALPLRGPGVLRSRRPSDQVMRGAAMLMATLMFFSALRYLPQAEATAINFLAPMTVLALAPWLLGEAPRLSRWVACGVAFVGVVVVVRPGGGLHPVGVMLALLTAACMAVQYIATRRVAEDDPLTTNLWSGAVGTVCLTLALPWYLPQVLQAVAPLGPMQWALLASTGLWGALGHLLQIGAYRNASASTLAPFIYLQIISASAVGWLLWGHFPDALTWCGIALICASGVGIGWLEWVRGRARLSGR